MKVTEFDPIETTASVLWSGEIAHAVDQHLALVERAEIAGLGIAEPDHAEQLVVDGIGDRDRVRKLFRRVDAVVMADRNVGEAARRGPGRPRLPRGSIKAEAEVATIVQASRLLLKVE